MKTTNELKTLVKSKVNGMRAYALKNWNEDFDLTIDYNVTSSRILGYFDPSDFSINLNEALLNEFQEVYINDVVIHEVCHAIIQSKYPFGSTSRGKRVMPHGKEFKAVCSHFGNDGKSTSKLFSNSETLKTAKAKNSRSHYQHKCNCTIHNLGKVRHDKINRGVKYTCRNCHTHLQPNFNNEKLELEMA